MSVADILRFQQPLTNQQLADMALKEDQAARAARAAGRHLDALMHQLEADKLAGLIR